jgi:hypothetical protein
MLHRRVILVACLFGGFTLLSYGVHRWPPDFVRREYYDARGSKRVEARMGFERGVEKRERLLGAADYMAATLLFAAGMVIRFLKFRWGAPPRSPQGDAFDMLVIGGCVLGGLLAAFLGVVALLSLAALRSVS